MAKDAPQRAVQVARPDGEPARAEKDIARLKKKDPRAWTKLQLLIERLKTNTQLPDTRFRPLGDGVFELKVHEGRGYRCFGFQLGEDYYLTHLERKRKSDRWVQSQIEATQAIRERHEAEGRVDGKQRDEHGS